VSRDPAQERRDALDRARTWVALDRLWAEIPDTGCKGLCSDSCGPIGMSEAERDRIERLYDIRIGHGQVAASTGQCPALTGANCQVYPHRPVVCRLWGASEDLPCPHGCEPEGGLLDAAKAMVILNGSLAVDGGHPLTQEQIERAYTDQRVAELLRARARGDRAHDDELKERLVSLWTS
jgi:Fe-S-cluster containining protein